MDDHPHDPHETDDFGLDFSPEEGGGFIRPGRSLHDPVDPSSTKRVMVYIAGPITNCSRSEARVAAEIRARAKKVMLEVEGVEYNVYDPAERTYLGSDHEPDEVYAIDHANTAGADLVLFHLTSPSLGVGIESQIAATATVPRIVAFRKGTPVSRMFDGVFSPTLATIAYDSADDFEHKLRTTLETTRFELVASSEKRRGAMRSISETNIGRTLLGRRIVLGLDLPALAKRTDIASHWLAKIETSPEALACTSLVMLNRLAAELGCQVTMKYSQVTLAPITQDLSRVELEALKGLLEFVESSSPRPDDAVVIGLWQERRRLVSSQSLAAQEGIESRRSRQESGKDALELPMGREQWGAAYDRRIADSKGQPDLWAE